MFTEKAVLIRVIRAYTLCKTLNWVFGQSLPTSMNAPTSL